MTCVLRKKFVNLMDHITRFHIFDHFPISVVLSVYQSFLVDHLLKTV